MDIMAVVLMIGIIAGLGLLLYGAFFLKAKEAVTVSEGSGETIEQLKQSAEEMDSALSNINSVSSMIIEEIDIKYKELLFLYETLEEKKKDILENANSGVSRQSYDGYEIENDDGSFEMDEDSSYNANLDIMEIGRKMDEVKRFPRLKNRDSILKLHESGKDVSQIAKELGIGKGEVQLIIGLSKVGVGNE